ncbi:hypothetical protein, partial [Syntrophothermus sp.]|uniref:hypothetical protein n=1 Tax=Syntrophothermus sp. TaxID=2736299 RepID=UPI0025798507
LHRRPQGAERGKEGVRARPLQAACSVAVGGLYAVEPGKPAKQSKLSSRDRPSPFQTLVRGLHFIIRHFTAFIKL